jgi:hypothetical protein
MYRRYQGFPDLKTLPKYDNYNDEKIEDAKLKEALKKRKKSLKNL